MKKQFLSFLCGALVATSFLIAIAAGTSDGLGPFYHDRTYRTNYIDLGGAYGPAPVMTFEGTNYTAVTTNIPFTALGVTNRLRVVNGFITGVFTNGF